MGIDDESSHPELCSGVADGVTHTIVSLFREPDAVTPPVRFDKRGVWKRGTGKLLRHRQTKGPVSARLYLNCRATPRLHLKTPRGVGRECRRDIMPTGRLRFTKLRLCI